MISAAVSYGSAIIYAGQELELSCYSVRTTLLDRLTCAWIKIEDFDDRVTLPKALQNIFKVSCTSFT